MTKIDLSLYTTLFVVVTDGCGAAFAATEDGWQLASVADLERFEEDDPTPFVELARAAHSRLNALA